MTHAAPAAARPWWVGAVVAVTVGALVLRLVGIAEKSLWVDEAFSWWLAVQPLDAIWSYVLLVDQHPPVYYSLLHLWLAPDDRETGLRVFSALWGVATVPVVALIGRRVAGPVVGLLAAVLQAVSPLHVWYAQQARMYTMLTFFAALATLAALYLLDTRGRTQREIRSAVAGLAVGVAGTMLSHNIGVLLPVVLAGVVAVVAVRRRTPPRVVAPDGAVDPGATVLISAQRRTDLRPLALGLGLGLAGWLPWLPGFLKQAGQVDAEFWLPPPTLGALAEHLRNMLSAHAPGPLTAVVALAAVGLAVAGCLRLRGRPEALLLLALFAGPLLLELLASIRRPIFYSQTLIWTSVPLIVLAAVALSRIRRRALVAAATAALLVLNTVSLVSYYRAGSTEDWEGAALYLAEAAEPGDLVLFNAGWTRIPFDFYYTGVGPRIDEHGVPAELFERGVLEPRMTQADVPRIDELLRGHRRVWLVYSHDWYTDPDGIVGRHLDSVLERVAEQRFTAIVLREYALPSIDAPAG
ncbi:Dolichyl-phosphate-mannose-protein mannosyltransferase [Pseudonocardia thermophila]|uniref:Dolichyl-phosphate-mannose-protein mannosyltransferase n=1 Tax=Pseudonocardia thermophila TaxID=1848 RepID=A0A1M6UYW9_PSETH|nr:glycosyltransferase family 39 protein [Pseudonocardia thermophila]SHK74380.1 Dolichyl-phosphate-mannose-protein mannosyltransferase [Pseudonocardia thermophila]